jgi:hypothetical protein
MALVNYTLPFGSIGGVTWATLSPLQHSPHATAVNSLLYGPSGHQETDNTDNYYKNNPYAPPVQQNVYQNQQYRQRNNNYLPPPTQPTITEPKQPARNVYQQPIVQQVQRTYGENSYSSQIPPSRQSAQTNNNNGFYNHNYNTPTRSYIEPVVAATTPAPNNRQNNLNVGGDNNGKPNSFNPQNTQANNNVGGYPPSRLPPTYTKVKSGVGSHTQVHAILDYDPGPEDEPEDEYYDDDDHANGKSNTFLLSMNEVNIK